MNVILCNAQIYPQYKVNRRPTVLAITKNKITAVGNDLKEIRKNYPRHHIINMRGKVVIPGFVDCHTHFYFWARRLDTAHLDGIPTFDKVLSNIKKFSIGKKPNEWIVGDGWSPDRWDTYHLPTAEELDRVTSKSPAALYSKDQHMLWVNSKAMKLAGINEKLSDPAGSEIDRYPGTNKPTGILRENQAHDLVTRLIKHLSKAAVLKPWKKASRIAYAKGITGFHSMDGPEGYRFFKDLHNKNKLSFRVHYYYPVSMLDELIDQKIISGDGDNTLQIGGVKIFMDGSLGAQSAYMKKPYRGAKNNYGVEAINLSQIKKYARKANQNGLACAVHAIGDKAVENIITALEMAGNNRLRNRIEHLQLISRTDLLRLKKTGAIASMQPSHCPSDRKIMFDYWGQRSRNAFIFKTLLNYNVPLAFGSDCPIEPLNPIEGIHAAVNRNGYGEWGGKFYPEESLTVAQAVYGFTAGAAYASGRENYSGKIAPGFQADLTILEDNIYSVPPSEIYKTEVAATIYDGRMVHHNNSSRIFESH